MNNKISVIIPVYNVAPYLNKCVRSVTQQSYTDLEIILVDDGSTDGSSIICDELKRIDSRIIVIHQENQGLSVARNTGLDRATGDWIAFLDSDDWIEKDMYKTLLEVACANGVEISSCLSRNCTYGGNTPLAIDSAKISIYSDTTTILEELRLKQRIRVEVWNKLWKKELIEGIRFVPGQVSEDVHFDRIAFLKANKIAHIDKTLHNYLIGRPDSTNSSFKMARFQVFDEYDALISDLATADNHKAICVVASMAARYVLNMYIEAIDKEQPDEIKQRLISIFGKYFRYLKHSDYMEKAVKVFSVSPKTYYLMSKLKAIINL